MWSWYKALLQTRPLPTKAVTSAITMGTGDFLCQTLEALRNQQLVDAAKGPPPNLQRGCPNNVDFCPEDVESANLEVLRWNGVRTATVAGVGLIWSGPMGHTWYNVLERVTVPRHKVLNLLCRLTLDALLWSPFTIAGYFSVRGLLEGKRPEAIWQNLQQKWLTVLTSSWCFWPWANMVNFSLVPLQFRLLFSNGMSLGWNTYLSKLSSDRLAEVCQRRATQAEDFVAPAKGGQSKAQADASKSACACWHCRELRA